MADAPATPLSEKDAPKTFGERGAAVPFTTAALMWARVRQRPNIKELLVPGLANTRGIYVFEWSGVMQRFTLTLHDRMLYRALAPEANPTPAAVARIATRIALGGSAGPEVQAAAEKKLRETDDLALLARFALTLRALDRMGGGAAAMTLAELRTDAGQQQAKQHLAKIAAGLGISAQVFYDRIETLGRMLGEVGLPGMPVKAPTRQLLQRMVQLTRVLNEWAEEGKGDAVVEARLIANVADETGQLASQYTALVDGSTAQVEDLLRDWDRSQRLIATAVDRLAWVLDGWDRLVNLWLDVTDKTASDQSQALALMSYLLPLVPPGELRPEDAAKWAAFSTTLYAQARAGETPATGMVDLDMMLRLEGHRTRDAS
jgi:hypothetical protein